MSTSTTDSPEIPSASISTSSHAVPTLEWLYSMTSEPENRFVIRGVDWAFYELVVDSIPEGANLHADYDGRDLEIMSLSPLHDGMKKRLGRFVELVAEELEIPCTGLGQTTWKRPELTRGLESDECYYFSLEKIATASDSMRRMSADVVDYPNPDLAIEVDLSSTKIDRAGIYAALDVQEVWRFEGRTVVIDRLREGGRYEALDSSNLLPVHSAEIDRWVLIEDISDGSLWARRLRAWVRMELSGRRTPRAG